MDKEKEEQVENLTAEMSSFLTAEDDGDEVVVSGEEEESLSPVARACALLFVAHKPVKFDALKYAAHLTTEEVEQAIAEITEMFRDETHGFSLHEVAGGYQFRTAAGAAATIKRYRPPKQRRLSKAAAETLAIIAYKQPIQRTEIENIRGVDALPTLKTLLDAKLVRIVGHEDSAGQPALYGTTEEFLEVFGLMDLAELPSLRELTEVTSDPGEVPEDADGAEILGSAEDSVENTENALQ